MINVRPIDANALVASLEESYKELRKLYDEIKDGDGAKEVYQGELITFLEAILRAKNAPTLDYEPVRHGEWMDNVDENGFLFNAWRTCSVCGGLNYSKKPSYCPSCGAKMDGGKKDG